MFGNDKAVCTDIKIACCCIGGVQFKPNIEENITTTTTLNDMLGDEIPLSENELQINTALVGIMS